MTGILPDFASAHEDHTLRQIGRCVWCEDCRKRLFQGRLPEGHPGLIPRPVRNRASDDMRARWGKD